MEDLKDVSFDETQEEVEKINEDVTFEMPALTKNLEDFKKNIEEEMKEENIVLPETNNTNVKKLDESTRPFKILDIDEIEDTVVVPKINSENISLDEKTAE